MGQVCSKILLMRDRLEKENFHVLLKKTLCNLFDKVEVHDSDVFS